MPRVIAFYQKFGDARLGEIELPSIPLGDLQAVFGKPKNDPMYDCYPISEEIADWFFSSTGITLTIGEFDYFLEFYN